MRLPGSSATPVRRLVVLRGHADFGVRSATKSNKHWRIRGVLRWARAVQQAGVRRSAAAGRHCARRFGGAPRGAADSARIARKPTDESCSQHDGPDPQSEASSDADASPGWPETLRCFFLVLSASCCMNFSSTATAFYVSGSLITRVRQVQSASPSVRHVNDRGVRERHPYVQQQLLHRHSGIIWWLFQKELLPVRRSPRCKVTQHGHVHDER